LKSLFHQKKFLVAFAFILVGLGARILFLSGPSLWLDEAISAKIIKGSMADCIGQAKTDLHPPLYYVLLHLWSFLGRDEFTLRLFSVLTNLLTGFVLFFCVRRMFDNRTALLTLLLFTISPFQIRYSQEVRMYSLVGLWMVLVLFFVWRYIETRNWLSLLGYVLSSALGIYTHYQTGIFLVILNAIVIVRLHCKKESLLLPWFMAQSIILVLFIPWLPYFISQLRGGARSWVPFHPSFSLLVSPLPAFLWGDPVLSRLKRPLGPILSSVESIPLVDWIEKLGLGIILVSVVLIMWRRRKQGEWPRWPTLFTALLFAGALGLSYGLSFKTNIYGTKYLFGLSYLFYMLLALLLTAFSRIRRTVGIGLGIMVMAIQVFMLIAYYQPANHRENWRGAVAHIRDHCKPNEVVGFHFDEPMAPYIYYSDNPIPAFGFIRNGELAPSLSAVTKGACDAVWLFDYLADLYDPGGRVSLDSHGGGCF
jgi:4-amino-4-deoxy-L-arabinose transferase-like glycosyltransferase